ncbi:hypothetical protein TSUD_47920 [Trifolium subterraneum]|nr:hypothetical protein TSUD_47920 [Trifolium subterraneum]
MSIEEIHLRYHLLTGKSYPGFVLPLLRRPPPKPTSSFKVPQRPSKPQPCIIVRHPHIPGVYVAGDHDHDDDDYESRFLYTINLRPGVQSFDQDVVFSAQKPGSRVLVIFSGDDAQFGITISHISDIVGPHGMVYVVETSNCKSLLDMAQADKRSNIVPIVSQSPWQYRMLINLVDVLFATLDSPEKVLHARLNATYFLKTGGHYMLYVQGNCIESTNRGDAVFSSRMKEEQVQFQRMERVTLEPFDRDHMYVSGVFRTLEDLPVYMLFESSCGYLVFRAHDVYNVERNYIAIEEYIKKFDEFFQLVACHPFVSDDEALKYLTADGNDTVPKELMDFLIEHLPPAMEGNKHCYSLALFNPFMADEIVGNARIACHSNEFHNDIIRGVRMNIDKFFENMKPGDLEKAQVHLARTYSRQKLDSPDKGKLPKARHASLPSLPTRRNPKRKARADTKTK